MTVTKELLDDLYNRERLSMTQIAQRVGCTPGKVAYWMRRYGLARRDVSEAIYQWYNPAGDPFAVRAVETPEARELFCLAIGLYIGEGKKKTHGEVAIANTNPQVIRTFMRFLQEICGVEPSQMVAGINVYDDVDLEQVQGYWEAVTGLPRAQFHKPVVRRSRGGTHLEKSAYGTVTVGFYSTKLQAIILCWCAEYLDKFGS